MGINGSNIAGGNPANGRVSRDFYTTNPAAVRQFIDRHYGGNLPKGHYLEPCVATGNIAEVIKEYGSTVTGVDIDDYGYPGTIVQNFLDWKTDEIFDGVITNPPFMLAEEFIRKSLKLLKDGGEAAFFLKIQFLECEKRRDLYEELPPKYIYVNTKRVPTWAENQKLDPKTGKPWATTMCTAWYVWQKGFKGEPIVRWIV